MPATHRRPRVIDTSRHFCPHVGCDYRGWLGLNNLRANGHPSGGPWRQLQCTSCEGYFLETHGTILHGKRVPVELLVRVLACLAEGLGIRATARVFEIDPNTVLQWLMEAAEQLRAFSAYFLCDMHINQLQLDELYAVLCGVKEGEISAKHAIKRLERSRHWVWTAIDPESKLLVAIEIGPRTLAMAQRVVHHVVQTLVPSCVPLCLTDGYRDYTMAILATLDAAAWATLCAGYQAVPASSYGRGATPRGVRYRAGGRASLDGMWLEDQHRLCGKTQPRYPSARCGGGASSEHTVQGRRRLARSADAVPDVP